MPGLSTFARLAAAALLALSVITGALAADTALRGRYLGFRLDPAGRALVVEEGSPADLAGMRHGDAVLEVGGTSPSRLLPLASAAAIPDARARAEAAKALARAPGPLLVSLDGGRTAELAPARMPPSRLVLALAPQWLPALAFAGVGLLLLLRARPRRGFPVALGLLFLAMPVDMLAARAWSPAGLLGPHELPLLALNLAGHLAASLAFVILLARFPRLDAGTGERGRATVLALLPGTLVLGAGAVLGHLSLVRAAGVLWGLAGLVFLFLNARRLEPADRERLRFVLPVAMVLVPLSIVIELPLAAGHDLFFLRGAISLGMVLIPAGFALAFVEHRLFDVERVARGTLVWAGLTLAVALALVAWTAAVEELLPDADQPWLRIGLAAAIVLALRPAHDRAQLIVDRMFFRGRFDHQRHLEELGERLALATSLDAVRRAVSALVRATVQAESHELTLTGPEEPDDPAGIRASRVPGGEALEIQLAAGGRVEGVLRLGPRRATSRYARADRRLLASASVPIALALARLRAIRELATANEALRRSIAELEGSQERLVRQERLAALGEMSSAIVHEIRHPLGIMGMGLHLLMRHAEQLPREAVQEIARIQSAHAECSEVIRVVQKVSRDLEVVAAPWDAAELVVESVSGMGDLASERRVEIESAVDDDLPPVSADRRTLTQALGILLRNAVEASPDGGSVRVRVHGSGPVHFEVSDEGPGVPEDDRERIFEPFYTTKPTGMGLGLAYARKVAQAHGGALALASSPRGARFVLTVPSWTGPEEALPARRRLRSA